MLITVSKIRCTDDEIAAYSGTRGHEHGKRWKEHTTRTVLDGLCGDFMLRVLVSVALDLYDDVAALGEAGVLASLETVPAGGAGVDRVERRPFVLVDVGAHEGVQLLGLAVRALRRNSVRGGVLVGRLEAAHGRVEQAGRELRPSAVC